MSSLISGATALCPLGCPRSGTTYLTRLLNAHPEILSTYETAVFLQLNNRIRISRTAARRGDAPTTAYRELWADSLERVSQKVIESYYEKIAKVEGKQSLTYWGDKHPHHGQHRCLEFIDHMYPAARYIYLVRDPRDTACSIAHMRSCNFGEAIEIWKTLSGFFEDFVSTHESQVLVLRYEDLVANPHVEMRRLLIELELSWHSEVDDFLRTEASLDVHSKGNSRKVARYSAKRSIGRWRREINREEGLLADQVTGDYCSRYGYSRAGDAH